MQRAVGFGSRDRRLYGTSGTALTLNADGTRTITDGSATVALKNYDLNVRTTAATSSRAVREIIVSGRPTGRTTRGGQGEGAVRPGEPVPGQSEHQAREASNRRQRGDVFRAGRIMPARSTATFVLTRP